MKLRMRMAGVMLALGMIVNAQPIELPELAGPYLGQKPPGMTPELFAPGIISNCTQHGSAYFSPDGREVYFSRLLPRPSVIMYMCEKDGRWTSPR
ncbi:MAG: hypothetical protein OEW18_00585, partial [Candidatus Aminicenantes bacterium]|nr:hypothetical protein [Candidatus Aminicenantes bacterium]